jgi:carbonic anhydrase
MRNHMKSFVLYSLPLWHSAMFAPLIHARVWTDIETFHTLSTYDGRWSGVTKESDPHFFSPSPSDVPSSKPSVTRTPSTSLFPSLKASLSPSINPTITSSAVPSIQVSDLPSESIKYPPNDAPMNPEDWYFDYRGDKFAEWGPGFPIRVPHNSTMSKMIFQNNAWATRSLPPDWYWSEFENTGNGPWKGILGTKSISKNKCNAVGEQSPIDLRPNGAECYEHHQIRKQVRFTSLSLLLFSIKIFSRFFLLQKGDFTWESGLIETQILSNKLRLKFFRRPCNDTEQLRCLHPEPPKSDFPNNWGGYADLLHVDFKIPSEHTIYGERFDGEMQMFHLHPTRKRTPTQSVLMKASSSGFNTVLQGVIDRFQYASDISKWQCANRIKRDRRRIANVHRLLGGNTESQVDYSSWGDFSTGLDAPDFELRRDLIESSVFTPHDPMLVPSLYFFGYEGSLTEPPCFEIVTWFVSDVPMQIGFNQLEQLKKIQFEYVDPFCNKISVHYRDSNARPIQDTFGRPVWRCTPYDFVADPPNS